MVVIVWTVFIPLEQKTNLNRVNENKTFFNVIVPFEDTEILEFNQNQKSDKAPFFNVHNIFTYKHRK